MISKIKKAKKKRIKGAYPHQPPPNQGYEMDTKHHWHTTEPNIALYYTSKAGQTTN